MGTKAEIYVQHADQRTISQVVLFTDGYPDHVSPILANHYNSQELADELVSMGNISILDERIHPADKAPRKWSAELGPHTWESRQIGVCLFYHRDAGKELRIHTQSVNDPIEYDLDHQYFWMGAWFVRSADGILTPIPNSIGG